jgi:ABC-2 type transport system permease protein
VKAFANHFAFEFGTGIRNKSLLMLNSLFPLGFYGLMGLIMGQINPMFLETMIPAMAVFAVLSSATLGLPDPLVTAREAGIFRSYKINGVPAASIVVIPALTSIVHIAVVATIITATAPLLFGAPLPVDWLAYSLTVLLLAFTCSGLGALIGVVSPSSRMTVLWSQLIFVPSMILGGMMLPHSMMPNVARRLAQLLPPTHAMNAFRGFAMGLEADFSPWMSVGVLAATGLLAIVLAIYLFNWDRHNATRRGNPLMGLLVLVPAVVGILVTGA